MATSTEHTFEEITARLDEIIATVRSKDTSLERSLDLFDEAISLGSKAVELVDSFDMSPSEAAMLKEAQEEDGESAEDRADTAGTDDADADAQDRTDGFGAPGDANTASRDVASAHAASNPSESS